VANAQYFMMKQARRLHVGLIKASSIARSLHGQMMTSKALSEQLLDPRTLIEGLSNLVSRHHLKRAVILRGAIHYASRILPSLTAHEAHTVTFKLLISLNCRPHPSWGRFCVINRICKLLLLFACIVFIVEIHAATNRYTRSNIHCCTHFAHEDSNAG
jgi:hypothetical protein